MSIKNKIAQYKESKIGVHHCTFNPDGPGVVRIHLVPPKFRLFGSSPYIVILNGYFMLPIGYSWAIVLSKFMDEVNRFDGKPISDEDVDLIYDRAVDAAHAIYRAIPREHIREDLDDMLDVIFAVARREDPGIELERLSIRAYSKNMTAPHRVDLMVSAMTDERGLWKCNQKCLFCYAAGEPLGRTREMTTDEWKTAIDRLDAAHVPMVTFTGGEPTLREDLDLLVTYARRMVTRLNTNGVALTLSLAEKLRAAGLDSIQITLYSHDEAIHNELVGAEHFADTVRGIKAAVAAGLDVSVNTPLCRRNADYLKTLEFVRSLGVRFVTASGLICTGTAGINHAEYDLDSENLYNVIRSAKEFCDGADMEIDFTSPGLIARKRLESLGMNVPMCGAALSNMAIAPDGRVIPCQSWLTESGSLGNILTDDFKKIWNAPLCKALRAMNEEEALSCPFRTKGDVLK